MFDGSFEYNMDYKLRDSMLNDIYGDREGGKSYDIYRFDNLTAEVLQELVDLKFADPDDYQNNSPTIGEILEFLKENSGFTAQGYAVTAERDDYRISIDGIDGSSKEDCQIQNFIDIFRKADEFQIGDGFQYAWYD